MLSSNQRKRILNENGELAPKTTLFFQSLLYRYQKYVPQLPLSVLRKSLEFAPPDVQQFLLPFTNKKIRQFFKQHDFSVVYNKEKKQTLVALHEKFKPVSMSYFSQATENFQNLRNRYCATMEDSVSLSPSVILCPNDQHMATLKMCIDVLSHSVRNEMNITDINDMVKCGNYNVLLKSRLFTKYDTLNFLDLHSTFFKVSEDKVSLSLGAAEALQSLRTTETIDNIWSAVEKKAIDFFLAFLSLKGRSECVALLCALVAAPGYIIWHFAQNYCDSKFVLFFLFHPDTFHVDETLCVSIVDTRTRSNFSFPNVFDCNYYIKLKRSRILFIERFYQSIFQSTQAEPQPRTKSKKIKPQNHSTSGFLEPVPVKVERNMDPFLVGLSQSSQAEDSASLSTSESHELSTTLQITASSNERSVQRNGLARYPLLSAHQVLNQYLERSNQPYQTQRCATSLPTNNSNQPPAIVLPSDAQFHKQIDTNKSEFIEKYEECAIRYFKSFFIRNSRFETRFPIKILRRTLQYAPCRVRVYFEGYSNAEFWGFFSQRQNTFQVDYKTGISLNSRISGSDFLDVDINNGFKTYISSYQMSRRLQTSVFSDVLPLLNRERFFLPCYENLNLVLANVLEDSIRFLVTFACPISCLELAEHVKEEPGSHGRSKLFFDLMSSVDIVEFYKLHPTLFHFSNDMLTAIDNTSLAKFKEPSTIHEISSILEYQAILFYAMCLSRIGPTKCIELAYHLVNAPGYLLYHFARNYSSVWFPRFFLTHSNMFHVDTESCVSVKISLQSLFKNFNCEQYSSKVKVNRILFIEESILCLYAR